MLRVALATALLGLSWAVYAGITTNCYNWPGPCPQGNECCRLVDSGEHQQYCKQLCAPYSDTGCCRWRGHRYHYEPVGSGCCSEVNNGNPNCWIITDATNLGDAFECVKLGETQPCNTNTQGGSCLAKDGVGGPGS